MSAKLKLLIAVIALLCVGGGIAAYKSIALGVPFWRGEVVYDWQVEAKVSYFAIGKPTDVRLSLPSIAGDRDVAGDSGSLVEKFYIERESEDYTAIWSTSKREGSQSLYFWVRFREGASRGVESISGQPDEIDISELAGRLGVASKAVVDEAKGSSTKPTSLFVELMQPYQRDQVSQEYELLKQHYEKEHRQNAPMVMAIELLKIAGVPARRAYGVMLNRELGAQSPVPLVEFYDGVNWKVRNPLEPATVLDGSKIFVWHRGGGPLLDVTGGENSSVTFTVASERVPQATLTDLQESPLLVSTVLGLPLAERAVFRYIVLIPLGAFVVVLLRNIVGIPTLGTFMPVLIALALLEIPILSGLIMFSVLIAAGLWFRFLLSRLNLLVVPRVAACVVIVTLLMILMSVLGFKIGMSGGAQITLFPMIILAWTIERMSLIWEEEGKRSALVQVGGSLLVSVFAFWFMSVGQIQYWAFYFPELLLVLLAGILIIGRYTGYRLSELIRFKTFQSA